MKKFLTLVTVLLMICAAVAQVEAAVFFDDFTNGPKADWGNERGDWYGHDGVYDAASPGNSPMRFTTVTTLPSLTDFIVDVDVQNLIDGGIYLRMSDSGPNGYLQNGVLLVTGGSGGSHDGLYWHTFQNGSITGTSPFASGLGIQGTPNTHLTIKVSGDTYEAYVNNSATAATTFTTNLFTSGKVGLYDFSSQTFDNFSVTYGSSEPGPVVPEPASLSLLGLGLGGLFFRKKRAA